MEFLMKLAVYRKLAAKYSYFRTYFKQDRYFDTQSLIFALNISWTSLLIKNIYMLTITLKWSCFSLFAYVCILIVPSTLSVNVIIAPFRLISTIFWKKNICSKQTQRKKKQKKSIKSKLLKTFIKYEPILSQLVPSFYLYIGAYNTRN